MLINHLRSVTLCGCDLIFREKAVPNSSGAGRSRVAVESFQRKEMDNTRESENVSGDEDAAAIERNCMCNANSSDI